MPIEIRPAQLTDMEVVRELFREYADGLGVDLCFQDFETELATLPGKYAPPKGRLVLAWDGARATGCVALRAIDDTSCEMKRLYVRPELRGTNVGRRLAESVCHEARDAGYQRICLDTLPTMSSAQRLYASLGFRPIAPYVFNPIEGVVFLGLDLQPDRRDARGVGERRSRGFTLIELVVVMAIIAILALMAVPLYHDKFIREQVVEAMRLTDIAKGPIAAAWASAKTFPEDNAAAGLPVPEKVVSNYVKSLTVESGAIHLVFGNQASSALRGKTLSLRPAVVADAPIVPVAWICGYAAAPDKMTVTAANRTDLPKGWLPVSCR